MFGFFKKKEKKEDVMNKEITLHAVCDGEIVRIEDVEDQVFAQKMMGDGFAIKPSKSEIFSPVNGTIHNVFPTKHAFGITSEDLEILLHMGIDTVSLEGKPFESLAKENDSVTPETQLSKVNFETLEAAGKDNVMIIIFTNGSEVIDEFELTASGQVSQGQAIGRVVLR